MHVEVRAECVPPAIHLEFHPDGMLIATTTKFIEQFYSRVLVDPDATSRIVLTIHELLENIAKYSTDGLSQLGVRMMNRDGQPYVQIRTRNSSPPGRIAELQRFMEEIRQATDPHALYQRFIAESVAKSEGSGLGLARIRAEAEMDLDYAIRGNEVTILAQARVELRRRL
jgi:hypothetical protein